VKARDRARLVPSRLPWPSFSLALALPRVSASVSASAALKRIIRVPHRVPVPCCLECVRVLPDAAPCSTCGKAPEAVEPHASAAATAVPAFNALREWARRQAHVQGAEPYMVLPKAAAARLALVQPETRPALRAVKGMGPVKDKDYGRLLTRFFMDLHASGAPPEIPVARAPMPDGLMEDEEAQVLAVREAARPIEEIFDGDPWDAVEGLVAKGATDLARLLVSPFDFALVARWLEAHPGADAAALRAALPAVSDAARRLVPLVVGSEGEGADTDSP